MIFDYGKAKTFLMAASAVALPLSVAMHAGKTSVAPKSAPQPTATDPRVKRLRGFFSRLHCPVANMSEDFVRAADQNHLDWRLLPSIAVVESGGGKAYKNNNIFGWNRGEQQFATLRSGLELVAYQLGHSPAYRRQNSIGKLHIYNEKTEYANAVMTVMNRIAYN